MNFSRRIYLLYHYINNLASKRYAFSCSQYSKLFSTIHGIELFAGRTGSLFFGLFLSFWVAIPQYTDWSSS